MLPWLWIHIYQISKSRAKVLSIKWKITARRGHPVRSKADKNSNTRLTGLNVRQCRREGRRNSDYCYTTHRTGGNKWLRHQAWQAYLAWVRRRNHRVAPLAYHQNEMRKRYSKKPWNTQLPGSESRIRGLEEDPIIRIEEESAITSKCHADFANCKILSVPPDRKCTRKMCCEMYRKRRQFSEMTKTRILPCPVIMH